MVDPAAFTRISAALSSNDPFDILRGLGALQLVPANAQHLLRLETAAAHAAGLVPRVGLPAVSNQRWRSIVNSVPVADAELVRLEDPANHLFTESVSYHGGSHVVFPGLEADAPFVLRQLLHAYFRLPPPFGGSRFYLRAARAMRAALQLSDAVARKAGLERNTASTASPHGTVTIPFPQEFATLQMAVDFGQDELEALLDVAHLTLDDLNPFVCELEAPTVVTRATAPIPVLLTPIVKIGDRYVVASPGTLLLATRQFLIQLAFECGVDEEVAERFQQSVSLSVTRSLEDYLGCPRLPVPSFDFRDLPVVHHCFKVDSDKVLSVMLITDQLDTYDPDNPFREWDADQLVAHVQDRLNDVEAHVIAAAPLDQLDEILHLIVVQGVGRPHTLRMDGPQDPLRTHPLYLSARDLEAIGLRFGDQPLVLWKFAEARDAARRAIDIQAFDTLDEFVFYLENDYRYFGTDVARPPLLDIPSNLGENLHREIADRYDFHTVPAPEGSTLVEAARINPDLPIPSFCPTRPSHRVQLVSEALPVCVWVLGPDTALDDRYHRWYMELARMVGYWLWQLAPSLGHLAGTLGQRLSQVVIQLDVVADEAWFVDGDAEAAGTATGIAYSCVGDTIHLQFAPESLRLFERPDNAAEREMVRALLQALGELAGFEVDEAIVDHVAPVGRKKMILRLRAANDRRLDDRDIQRSRLIQKADVNAVLDETGRFLAEDQGRPIGLIAPDERVAVLDAVLTHQLGELETLVRAATPHGLLEALLAHNEALIHHEAKLQTTLPTRQACFAEAVDVVEELRSAYEDTKLALVASRYLIEYVAAQPPNGLRPVSQSLLDRAIAIASEIVYRSKERDEIKHGLTDPEMELLPSGRLGVERRTAYELAMERLSHDYAFGEASRSYDSFEGHWRPGPDSDLEAALTAMDDPTRAEFGLTFRELRDFLSAVMALGDELPGAGKTLKLDEFTARVAAILDWPCEQVETAIEVFIARPRDQFLELPPPYNETHLSAANFARPFSYLRKPLIQRPTADGDEVVWGNRNLSLAGNFLWNLLVTKQYPARTEALKSAMDGLQKAEAIAFNDQVAALYRALPDTIVCVRVEEFSGQRIERKKGHDLGDIDVLVVDPRRKRILAVEVKDFAGARTPWEYKRELDVLFASPKGQTTVQKHEERIRWLLEHREAVLLAVGLPADDAAEWQVDPLVVVDKETPTPYLAAATMPVRTYQRLRAELQDNTGV